MRRPTPREPRDQSVTLKLTLTEFRLLDARATPEASPTEIARDLVLRGIADPDPDIVALMAEVLAMREAMLNCFNRLAAGVLTPELVNDTIAKKADDGKRARALTRLAKEA